MREGKLNDVSFLNLGVNSLNASTARDTDMSQGPVGPLHVALTAAKAILPRTALPYPIEAQGSAQTAMVPMRLGLATALSESRRLSVFKVFMLNGPNFTKPPQS